MKVAEREEDTLELCLLGAHLQGVLVKVVKGLVQIGLHPGGGFIGDLDSGLQDALRNDVLLRGAGRLSAEKDPVVFMGAIRVLFNLLLQGG